MINIEYKDISLTAKQDLNVLCDDKQEFSNLDLLKQDNVEYKKFATLEKDFWILNGTFENFPDTPRSENFSIWSKSMSDEDKNFNIPIELNFSGYESSVGVSISFSTLTNDYPTNINLKWYQDESLLSDVDFEVNESEFFCENSVSNFNKIIITCSKMNKPYRYLKLQGFVFGLVRNFDEEELKGLTLLEDVSLTSEEIKINTLEFILKNKKLIDFIFQKKQPLTLTRNNVLLGTFFIDTAKQKSKNLYEISAIDYIGMLDKMPFSSKTYESEKVATIVKDVIGDIPYELDEELSNKTLSGTIPDCSRREALLQIAFATCAIVDTSRSDKINIYKNNATVVSKIENGVYEGESFDIEDEITEIKLTLNNNTVISKKNPVLSANTLENVLEFTGVFLDDTTGPEVLDYLYDFYIKNKNKKTNMKFIVKNNEKVGDVIEHQTEYLGIKRGQITQMKFSFNSFKFVAQAELKDLEG